jgi:hypothetical protein
MIGFEFTAIVFLPRRTFFISKGSEHRRPIPLAAAALFLPPLSILLFQPW